VTRIAFAVSLAALCAASTAARAVHEGWRDRRDRAVGLVQVGGSGICTGTLVARQVVLTARHCLNGAKAFWIGPGTANTVGVFSFASVTAGMTSHEIEDREPFTTAANPGCPKAHGDVGLLRLKTPVDAQIPAVGFGARTRGRATCEATGYGLHPERSGGQSVGAKRRTQVRVVSADATNVLVDGVTGISDHGDSGGPLYCSRGGNGDFVYGVGSCIVSGNRVAYATVDPTVATWIRSTIARWFPPAPARAARRSRPAPARGAHP
jgi:protease YdgD